MAGSYRHITEKIDGETQFIGCTLLDHLGDAYEALEECWFLVHYLSGDDDARIKEVLEMFNKDGDDLAQRLKQRLKNAIDNNWWEDREETSEDDQ